MLHRSSQSSKAFTLIELLVVIAIVAILSVVVVLTLNPAELLRQSRDSNRISDMSTLNSVLSVYNTDQNSAATFTMGSSSVVYVSIPDFVATSTLGTNCASLGLPTLPAGYSYHCASSTTLRLTNGTGWIPVNLAAISSGSPVGNLPIDPVNTSSSRDYYTYTTNGTQFELSTAIESAKYKIGGTGDVIGPDGATLSTVYAKGTNLSLEPMDYGDATLVGHWPLNEGAASIAYDYSGNNATGTWNGTQVGTSGYYSAGQVGSWAGAFDGSTNKVVIPNAASLNPTLFSIAAWVNLANASGNTVVIAGKEGSSIGYGINIAEGNATTSKAQLFGGSATSWTFFSAGSLATSTWYFIAGTYDGLMLRLYVNGVNIASAAATGNQNNTSGNFTIGDSAIFTTRYFPGLIDDVRVYNRALSPSEVAAMYAGGK